MFQSRKGKISARDLGPLLRCLGLNPSERDLEEARHEIDVSGKMTESNFDRPNPYSYMAREVTVENIKRSSAKISLFYCVKANICRRILQ